MNVLLIVLAFLVMIPFDVRTLRRGNVAVRTVYTFLWGAGLTLSLLMAYHVPIDHVTRFLRGLFEPLGKAILTLPPD